MRTLFGRVALIWPLALVVLLAVGWSLVYFSAAPTPQADILTEEERAWLRQHSRLRLAPDPNFPPIEFFDEDGVYRGLVADYYELIGDALGVNFLVVQASSWDEVLTMARNGDVDIVGGAQQTPEREEYLKFSQPIIDIPNVIITSGNLNGDITFDVLTGKRLAVTRSNALHEYVKRQFPGIELVPVEDDLAGLREVSFGRVDATVVNLAIATWLIEKHGFANLRVAGDSGRSNALHIATRKDWPILNSILSKALASLPEAAREDIQRRWIHLDGLPMSARMLVVMVTGATGVALLLFIILFINHSLRRQVSARTAALNQELLERKLVEERVHFLAYHDVLTHLPNRVLIQERFSPAALLADSSGECIVLLYLDLDNFKTVNDSLGHAAGDSLLKEVALRLTDCVRDAGIISRQGGDEFLIMLTSLADNQNMIILLQKILQRLAEPVWVNDHEFVVTVSVGVAVYPSDGRDFVTLLKKADMALYRAKASGRNAYKIFDETMNTEAVEHLATRNGLRRALEQNELLLHYQPQVDLPTGHIIGAEALLRWQHPEQGLLPPARFIAIAEESHLIVPMGEWVIREACRQAVAWKSAGLPEFTVAVNLSAVQFHNGDLVECVTLALQETGHCAEFLELELTESILLHQVDAVLETVMQLKKIGVKLSIDDFGTGYSSLSYLKRFDIDKLKIDQSFIRDITTDPDDSAIVRAIIQMGQSLNLKIIAEGVETLGMLEHLCKLGCDEAQGYYFAKPMPADTLAKLLEHTTRLPAPASPAT